ncbi:MAG TPA: TlpA disulfide reductase family protein [Terriglobales bacterium]|nr:TlpA disulfide reductase family protein [Terriglobales bacterium]
MKRISRPLLLLVALSLAGCYRGTHPPRIGNPAPDFTIQDGATAVTLHNLREKVVVLNFWATWCPPCIQELPSLEQLQSRFKDRGVEVVGISVDVDGKAYQQFLKDHKVDFLTVRDPDQKTNSLYGTFKFPETYIIDRRGILRRKFIGAVDWNEPEIVDFLSKL